MIKTKTVLRRATTGIILTGLVVFSFVPNVRADQYDDKINALQQSINANTAQVNELNQKGDTLANKVSILNSQISQTVSKLDLAQAKAAQITQDLAIAEQKLITSQAILAENVKTIYIRGRTSFVETLVASDSFSDFIDREQYQLQLQSKVEQLLVDIAALKDTLTKQKSEQVQLILEQRGLQDNLNTQRGQVAGLLYETRGEEAAYQSKVAAEKTEVARLKREQAAAIAAISRNVTHGGCGGYPSRWCSAPLDSMVDDWGMYNRECVSYTAWKRSAIGRPMPYWGGYGNANQWPDNARRAGYRVDRTPAVGAVAITMAGRYGHAMMVERVNGNSIHVSQYNAGLDRNGNPNGLYSESDVYVSSIDWFIH